MKGIAPTSLNAFLQLPYLKKIKIIVVINIDVRRPIFLTYRRDLVNIAIDVKDYIYRCSSVLIITYH